MAYSVDIADHATPLLEEARRVMSPGALAKVAGRAGQQFVQRWFTKLEADRPNKMGWPRQHFFAQAARATHFRSDESGANVSVNQVGLRQRIQGGPIVPRSGDIKNLTIPEKAEAYGTRASEWTLKFAFAKDEKGHDRPALVEPNAPESAVFWLIPKAMQKPDPTIFPDMSAMTLSVLDALRQAVDIRKAKAGGAS